MYCLILVTSAKLNTSLSYPQTYILLPFVAEFRPNIEHVIPQLERYELFLNVCCVYVCTYVCIEHGSKTIKNPNNEPIFIV